MGFVSSNCRANPVSCQCQRLPTAVERPGRFRCHNRQLDVPSTEVRICICICNAPPPRRRSAEGWKNAITRVVRGQVATRRSLMPTATFRRHQTAELCKVTARPANRHWRWATGNRPIQVRTMTGGQSSSHSSRRDSNCCHLTLACSTDLAVEFFVSGRDTNGDY